LNDILRVHDIIESSGIYGPGDRFVLWVQGCTLGCKGCWNKETWDSKKGFNMRIDEIVSQVVNIEGIEGITILGGEPLQQSDAILNLMRKIRSQGLTIMLYTGFELDELNGSAKECCEIADILIAGRYIESLRDPYLRWRGSSNQILESPTGAYNLESIEDFQELEIFISNETGEIIVTGYPDEV
jgi:anaerobic ribonucleoside-triphosphate reductase activating protein|tara:strand:- start:79 stop:633 length:555 start_codon:yes stop_codon:yes gene_type:complete